MEDLLTIGIILVVSMYVIYYLVDKFVYTKSQYSMIEGLENQSQTSSTNNIAANAKPFADSLKSVAVSKVDTLLIPKYRTDYENAIINTDDYISALMLEQLFKMDMTTNKNTENTEKNINILTKISQLQSAKTALNSIMTFVDKQK
jgi:hypothetical protein